jgi:gamma-glutamyltranspeptidase/glutathione hydrolase
MLETARGQKGVVTSPHRLASQAGLEVLKEGGTAVEAAVAVAAALCVVYPHMNSLGGDGFWLIAEPGKPPHGVESCGRAARAATLDLYRSQGLSAVPWRGPLAANTVAGMVAGWRTALTVVPDRRLPLKRLLAPAIVMAEEGVSTAGGLAAALAEKTAELSSLPNFSGTYLQDAETLKQPALAATLRRLSEAGLDDFYRGDVGRALAADLEALGSPVSLADIEAHEAIRVRPLELRSRGDSLVNLPPPTQGFASLMILALFDRLGGIETADGFEHVHALVEATKLAFLIRDRHIGDPAYSDFDPQAALNNDPLIDHLAARIDPGRALEWPQPASGGDTVWFGAMDDAGRAVSVIQSTYFEFGSGLVLPRTGVIWQNRGASFRLAEGGWNALKPGRKPFHTLNPALAQLQDGRLMAYGSMGGEGQPQTQAAVFTRYARFGQDLQAAISAPRWLLGRTWGEESAALKMESRFPAALFAELAAAGHKVEPVAPMTSLMGHAGPWSARPTAASRAPATRAATGRRWPTEGLQQAERLRPCETSQDEAI